MELTILSLNLRIWTKHKSPCDENFWLKRTCQQAALFDKYDPDIICVQERIWPVGQMLLGLTDYKVFGNRCCRLPIFVKKSLCKEYDVYEEYQYAGTGKDNGHGHNVISIHQKGTLPVPDYATIFIQNSHLSLEPTNMEAEINNGFRSNTIVCGDFNTSIHTFYRRWREVRPDKDNILLYYDEGDPPTYISYNDPNYKANLDHFGVVGRQVQCTHEILPERTSDHFPILAKFII